jgi:hypothetical protein
MEEEKTEYCNCIIAGIINDGVGIDINCHYCGREVKGQRENFENSSFYEKYIEVEPGCFILKQTL